MLGNIVHFRRDGSPWVGRMTLIVLVVALADGLAGVFARKPFPWVVIIPSLIPLLTVLFVIPPVLKSRKTPSQRR